MTSVSLHFGDRVISRRLDPAWASHSPDLNPPDFYLWGNLKDQVYEDNPVTIEQLKRNITAKMRAITQEECIRVVNNFARRIAVCVERDGRHLEHILK